MSIFGFGSAFGEPRTPNRTYPNLNRRFRFRFGERAEPNPNSGSGFGQKWPITEPNRTLPTLDDPDKYLDRSVSEVANELFQEHYVRPLGDVVHVQLQSEWCAICQGHILIFFCRNAHKW